jgi:anti-anti-sigma factor
MADNSVLPRPEQPDLQLERAWTSPVLRVTSHWVRPGVQVYALIGEIDLATAPIMRRALTESEQRRIPRMVVDLSRVRFLGVAGACVLMTAADRARDQQRRLSLAGGDRAVSRALEVTGFDQRLVRYRCLSEALAAETADVAAVVDEAGR